MPTTPLRFANHLNFMFKNPSITIANITSTINDYRTAANADKEYDIKYYCDQLDLRITTLTGGGWAAADIKAQLAGQLSAIINDAQK